MQIDYRDDADICVEDGTDVYRRSTLDARRPIDRPDIVEGIRYTDLMISVWEGERLIGIACSQTNYTNLTDLADLAVNAKSADRGIGKQLIKETQQRAKPECMIVLLAAPKANEYYSRLGFEHNPRAWVLSGR